MSDDQEQPPGPPLRLVPDDDAELHAPDPESGGYPQRRISPHEALLRRQALTALIFAAHPIAEVHLAMAQKFGMTEEAIERLEAELYNQWMQEDKRRRPFLKQIRIRQLERAVVAASKDKAHGAVMKGSELLAKMEGTQAPIAVDVHQSGEVQVAHTWARYLDEMPPEELHAMIAAERLRLSGGEPVEVEAVAVEVLPASKNPADP